MTDPAKYLLIMAACLILLVALVSFVLWVCNRAERGQPDPFKDLPDDPGDVADRLQKRKEERDAGDR